MCNFVDQKIKYTGCKKKDGKHVISKMKYDWCDKAKAEGYACTDATPAKGLNDEVIQFGTTQAAWILSKMLLLNHTVVSSNLLINNESVLKV